MNPLTRRTGATVLALALIAIAVVLTAQRGNADPRRITVFEPAGQGSELWFGISTDDHGSGADAGDILLEHKPLLDPGTGKPTGTAVTRVQVVDVLADDAVFIIDCTIQLPDGDLVFYGAARFSDLGQGATFAVIGGTGSYDRSAGVVTVSVAEPGATIAFSLGKR